MSRAVNRIDKVTDKAGEEKMKKLLALVLTIGFLFAEEDGGNYFVDNFLKYSTFYSSISLQAPFEPQQKFDFD